MVQEIWISLKSMLEEKFHTAGDGVINTFVDFVVVHLKVQNGCKIVVAVQTVSLWLSPHKV